MNPRLVPALLLGVPAFALASLPQSSISNELGFGVEQTDPSNPRAGMVTDTLAADVAVGAGWSVNLMLGLAYLEPTPRIPRQQYATTSETVVFVSPGVRWEATDHFTFGLTLEFAPSATNRSDTTLPAPVALSSSGTADALIRSTSSSWGSRLSASYDTASAWDFETAIDLDVGFIHFDANQLLLDIRDPATGAPLDRAQYKAQIAQWCTTHTCTKQDLGLARNLLRDQSTPLDQIQVRLRVTETLYEDWDVGLAGSYYLYDRDPTEIGFYSLASAGRAAAGLDEVSPLAPLRWTLRPEVTRRFGALGVRLWYEHGLYVDDEGVTDVLGLKLQYMFSSRFRMWLMASWQRDRDAQDNVAAFVQGALGAMWLF